MGAESKHYFSEFDAIAVNERPLPFRIAQVLVVDDHRPPVDRGSALQAR